MHQVTSDSMSGGMRYASIDKPIIDLPKRQSAIVKESRHITGVGEAMTRGATQIEQDTLSDGSRQIASAAKSNGGKLSSRGSVRRRVFGNNNGNGYYTNA